MANQDSPKPVELPSIPHLPVECTESLQEVVETESEMYGESAEAHHTLGNSGHGNGSQVEEDDPFGEFENL